MCQLQKEPVIESKTDKKNENQNGLQMQRLKCPRKYSSKSNAKTKLDSTEKERKGKRVGYIYANEYFLPDSIRRTSQ